MTTRKLCTLWRVLSQRVRGCERAMDGEALTWGEFQLLASRTNAMIIKRLFDLLDRDRDGSITREDFVAGIWPLVSPTASAQERLDFLFACYDLDDVGAVSRAALLVHLHLHELERGVVSAGSSSSTAGRRLTIAELEQLTDATFMQAQLDPAGRIGLASFVAMQPQDSVAAERLLKRLCLDVDEAITSNLLELSADPCVANCGSAHDGHGGSWSLLACCMPVSMSMSMCMRQPDLVTILPREPAEGSTADAAQVRSNTCKAWLTECVYFPARWWRQQRWSRSVLV